LPPTVPPDRGYLVSENAIGKSNHFIIDWKGCLPKEIREAVTETEKYVVVKRGQLTTIREAMLDLAASEFIK